MATEKKLMDENGLAHLWPRIKTLFASMFKWDNLADKPTIGDGTLSVSLNGGAAKTFTANQTGNTTIELQESDPVFAQSPAHGITSSDITAWDNKYNKPSTGIPKSDLASGVQTILDNTSAITGVDSSIASGSASTNVPTSAAVEARISEVVSASQIGAAMFKGTISSDAELSGLTGYKAGWYWLVDTEGTYAGQQCEAGDFIYAIEDYASSYKASDFKVVQANIRPLTNAEIDAICTIE